MQTVTKILESCVQHFSSQADVADVSPSVRLDSSAFGFAAPDGDIGGRGSRIGTEG